MDSKKGFVKFTSSTSGQSLDVLLDENKETIWASEQQIAALFERDRTVVSKHIKNIFTEKELIQDAVCAKFAHTANDDKTYNVTHYNLDVIISVGYRVKSKRGTQFRIWANTVLKEYLLKGYAFNSRMDQLEKRVVKHDEQIELLINTSLPPKEGIFYEGQIFDAYIFASNLIKSAKKSILIIDNYIDDSVLILLSKRSKGVSVEIYTQHLSKVLKQDIEKHNTQYEPITVNKFSKSHDRFLVIDNKDIYLIGASLKDLGKKWFAFSKLTIDVDYLLMKLKE